MNELVLAVATRRWGGDTGWYECVKSWSRTEAIPYSLKRWFVYDNDVVPAYQEAFENTDQPIIGHMHDDLMVYEKGWDARVLREFADPGVGLVGFGGALGHGTPNLYEVPYHLPNLARQNFMSNLRHAEQHGTRFTGERDVAVLDGFALFVRRSILDKAATKVNVDARPGNPDPRMWVPSGEHGWPVHEPYGYFMYSEWLCCETRRQGYRIRLVGVDCDHLGGKSSGFISPKENYELAHSYFYEHNRDVMPWRVPE